MGARLKGGARAVETPDVKTCPRCAAELRPSVIRCTSCGASMGAEGDARPTPDASGPVPADRTPAPAAAPAASATATAVAPGDPGRVTVPGPSRPVSSVWATPDGTSAPARAVPAAVPTRSTARSRPAAPSDLAERRALPTGSKRSTRPDVAMMLAALVTGFAAYQAYDTFALRWVQLSLSRADTEGEVSAVGTASFRASEALVGTLGQAVVLVLGASALLWLFFGLQRGWNMPWFATPAIGILASLLGLAGTVMSSALWFVWRDAMVENATRFGITRDGLLGILEDTDHSPIVDLQRLAGPGRFASMLGLALLASCATWWAYRKRSS